MKRFIGIIAAGLLSGSAASAQVYDAPASDLPAVVQRHIDLAYLILDGDVSRRLLPAALNVIDGKTFPDPIRESQQHAQLPAVRAFDQLYYLGTPIVSAWAINTSGGIILIDTLDNSEEAQSYIEGGLKSVGLDPARIKYILLSHGHSDHYGGAKYLAEKYHAHILMSPVDWKLAARYAAGPAQPGRPAPVPAPTHDMDVVDGQTLTLGKTTLTLYITPGHTPGTVSAIFPVTDHGRPHVVSYLGGMGMASVDKNPAHGGFALLRSSMLRFGKKSLDAKADVLISCHPFMDDSWDKARAVANHTSGSTSPWVVGVGPVLRYYAATAEAVDAAEAFFTLNPPAARPPG